MQENCIVITRGANGWVISMPVKNNDPMGMQGVVNMIQNADKDPMLRALEKIEDSHGKNDVLPQANLFVFTQFERVLGFLSENVND